MSTRQKAAVIFCVFCLVEIAGVYAIAHKSSASTKDHVAVHSVAVMGDSLVFLSTADLRSQLSPLYPNPEVAGILGIGIAGMRLGIEQMHDSKHPDAVVIALGTNDACFAESATSPQQKAAEIQNSIAQQEGVLQTLSDTPCVIWVGVQEHNASLNLLLWGPQLNAGFQTNVAAHPNAHFLDWESQMKAHPEWQHPDGLHFSETGTVAYATAITQAVSQLC